MHAFPYFGQGSAILDESGHSLWIFIHSGYFYSASSSPLQYSRHSTDTVSEYHAEAPHFIDEG